MSPVGVTRLRRGVLLTSHTVGRATDVTLCPVVPEPVDQNGQVGDKALRAPGDVLVHLRRARDHADRAYAEPLDVESLAAVAGLSKFHFLRLFKATYGLTPGEYVSQRRIERAQDLLRATNLTVTEVCHAVGFSSLGSFSSRFRSVVGETPMTSSAGMPRPARRTSRAATSSCGASPSGRTVDCRRGTPQSRRSTAGPRGS